MSAGADLEVMNDLGETPIKIAVDASNLDIGMDMVRLGATVANAVTRHGRDPSSHRGESSAGRL